MRPDAQTGGLVGAALTLPMSVPAAEGALGLPPVQPPRGSLLCLACVPLSAGKEAMSPWSCCGPSAFRTLPRLAHSLWPQQVHGRLEASASSGLTPCPASLQDSFPDPSWQLPELQIPPRPRGTKPLILPGPVSTDGPPKQTHVHSAPSTSELSTSRPLPSLPVDPF